MTNSKTKQIRALTTIEKVKTMSNEMEEPLIRVEVGTITVKIIAGVGSLNIGETCNIQISETDSKKEKSTTEDESVNQTLPQGGTST